RRAAAEGKSAVSAGAQQAAAFSQGSRVERGFEAAQRREAKLDNAREGFLAFIVAVDAAIKRARADIADARVFQCGHSSGGIVTAENRQMRAGKSVARHHVGGFDAALAVNAKS